MESSPRLPEVGDFAPAFLASTDKAEVQFPANCKGNWCILFAHPANFISAWTMYSTFLTLKERWFHERNTTLIGLCNEPIRPDDWSEKARRYASIFLKASIIVEYDFKITNMYGLLSGRKKQAGFDRIAYIIDPEGVIQVILKNPMPSIESAIKKLEQELDRLQSNLTLRQFLLDSVAEDLEISDTSDASEHYTVKAVKFNTETLHPN
jgi:peroxiredoxin (alkyl hydroperoxide reductase subunit C)